MPALGKAPWRGKGGRGVFSSRGRRARTGLRPWILPGSVLHRPFQHLASGLCDIPSGLFKLFFCHPCHEFKFFLLPPVSLCLRQENVDLSICVSGDTVEPEIYTIHSDPPPPWCLQPAEVIYGTVCGLAGPPEPRPFPPIIFPPQIERMDTENVTND